MKKLILLCLLSGCNSRKDSLDKSVDSLKSSVISIKCSLLLMHEGLKFDAKDYNMDGEITVDEKIKRVTEFTDLCFDLFKTM